ncbi:mycothiol transferase, partial [Kribbella sp. NPDC002412]
GQPKPVDDELGRAVAAAETAQHAGHADIIRESIDGQKTMG